MIVALIAILQDCACDSGHDRRERRDLGNGACPHDLEFEERLDVQAHAARNQTCWLRSHSIGELSSAADVPFDGRIEIAASTSPLIIGNLKLFFCI
jgi:hypothetical protein